MNTELHLKTKFANVTSYFEDGEEWFQVTHEHKDTVTETRCKTLNHAARTYDILNIKLGLEPVNVLKRIKTTNQQ